MKIDALYNIMGRVHMVTLMGTDEGDQYVLGFVSAHREGQPFAGCVWHDDEYVPIAGDTLKDALTEAGRVTGLDVPVTHD